MTERNLQITFHLDGTGVYYDPCEPPMLDGLLSSMRIRHQCSGEPPGRDEKPFEVRLPLARHEPLPGSWCWKASALFPVEDAAMQQIIYIRKRFRQAQAHLSDGSPNLTNGTYRDWNAALPLLMTRALRGWCVYTGDRKPSELRKDFEREVKYIGKKRAQGRGNVIKVTVEMIDEDYSLMKDSRPTRYIPDASGTRLVRPRPPYWNNVGRVPCTEIG